MKEQMRTKMEQVTRKIYIADDGTEFSDRAECVKYEQEIYQPLADAVEALRINELSGAMPIGTDEDCAEYEWYQIESQAQMELLREFYHDQSLGKHIRFPDIVCIQFNLEYAYATEYSLQNLLEYTRDFWNRFDYSVTLQPKNTTE